VKFLIREHRSVDVILRERAGDYRQLRQRKAGDGKAAKFEEVPAWESGVTRAAEKRRGS
jgi:hypothetical protein